MDAGIINALREELMKGCKMDRKGVEENRREKSKRNSEGWLEFQKVCGGVPR